MNYHSPSIWPIIHLLLSWLLSRSWILYSWSSATVFIECSNNLFILCKNIFHFDIFPKLPTLNLESLSFCSTKYLRYVPSCTSARIVFDIPWYYLLYFPSVSFSLSMYRRFDMAVIYLWILIFKILMNLSPTTDFSFVVH